MRKIYKLHDEAIGDIKEIIQEAIFDEKSATSKLRELKFDVFEGNRLVVADEGKGLSDKVLMQLGHLVSFSLASRTPFVDHVRQIKLEVVDDKFELTPEYVEFYNGIIENLTARAKDLASKAN